MSYKIEVPLSPELKKYRDNIEATIKPYIEIAIENNSKVNWWQSKFGGFPYLPKGFDYPTTPDGQYLFLVAQINFAEVPPLESFPDKGILQFYTGNEFPYGFPSLYDKNYKEKFKVLYFPEPDLNPENIITNYEFLPEHENFPLYGCCSLQFTKKYVPITFSDNRFDRVFLPKELYELLEDNEDINDEYSKLSAAYRHKIGGYPDFMTNGFYYPSDPKYQQDSSLILQHPDILLLQIACEENKSITIWPDGGIVNFWIDESELRQLNFSNVDYYWDWWI